MRLNLSLFALACFALAFFALNAVPSLEAAARLPAQPLPRDGETATWSVYDSEGAYVGFTTTRTGGGEWRWSYYEAGEPPVLASDGSAQDVGDGQYTWQSDGGESGTVTIAPDGQSGTWTNTNGTAGTITYLGP